MTVSHAPPPATPSVTVEEPPPRTPPDLEAVTPRERPPLAAAGGAAMGAAHGGSAAAARGVASVQRHRDPPSDVLASPGTIARAGADLVADGTLPSAMGVSLQRVVAGLLLGGTIGTALALVSGLSRLGEDLVDATVQMLRTVPWVGLIPLFIIWLGIGEAPKVALIALGVAFHLYLNVYAGIRGVDAQLIEAGTSLGLGRWGLVRHVVLPGALPGAMTGLRYSLATAWLALVFGESINADAGIGFLMNQAREFFRTDVIVVCLVVYAFLGLTADVIVRILERLLLQWRPTFTGQ
ncbi:ABC transporter permease [Streptomyces californicus]